MGQLETLSHWRVEADAHQHLWATFDKAGTAVNSMSEPVLAELEKIIEMATNYKGLVIRSGKPAGFIAGADIQSFKTWNGVDDAMKFIRYGQAVYQKLAQLSVPTVALINGFCLGGGLELALACRYRVADDDEKTKLGLPEVFLGIFPGWGGTVRLPKLIGGMQAIDLILSGRSVSAKSALAMGLIDAMVPKRHAATAVEYYLTEQPAAHRPTFFQSLTNTGWMKSLIGWKVRKDLAAKKVKKQHYPAFYAALEHFINDSIDDARAIDLEADALRGVLEHPTAMNLVRVYGLQERLKAFAKVCDFKASHVHVIGAGVMGAEIAAVCALRGCQVTLQDRAPQYIAPAIKQAHDLFKKKLKQPRLIQAAMDRLMPDVEGRGVVRADVIIEAIYENLEAKQTLFKDLEQRAKKDAILATNTSTFPLAEISTVLKDPKRLVGIHFFNPVSKMQLVEVVFDNNTHQQVIEKAQAFVGQIDKLPLPVKSSPGFLVNRVLMPYLLECVTLVDEKISISVIDKAATDFGMPMGPVELADRVGLDICLSAATSMSKHYSVQIPQTLKDKVEKGELGRKSGKGFYQYQNGKIVRPASDSSQEIPADLATRLVNKLIHEARACLQEGVVSDADLVDAGMIFGTGFAPFRGGPMHYAELQK